MHLFIYKIYGAELWINVLVSKQLINQQIQQLIRKKKMIQLII